MKTIFIGVVILKISIKIFSLVICVLVAVLGFSSCKEDDETPSSQPYVYHPSDASTSSGEDTSNPGNTLLSIDTSWKKNYTVTYTYFNTEQGTDKISVCEKRSTSYFSAEDTVSGDTLFYKTNGSDIDRYVIVPTEKEQIHSVIEGKTLDDLSSTFMKLTEVDADLPQLSNVLFMYGETVGGRECDKYIQRAYSSGKLTENVYVWIDKQFGFAVKGEVYNAENKLTASWEVESFAAGNTKDSDVAVDLDKYTFKDSVD